jgi:hypothetical protein
VSIPITLEAALDVAKAQASTLRLYPTANPPRNTSARVLEYLARRAYAQRPSRPRSSPRAWRVWTGALLSHVTPLIVRAFFRGPASCPDLAQEDYAQEVGVRLLLILDRYYDPRRGPFVALASLACQQVGAALCGKLNHRFRNELLGGTDNRGDSTADAYLAEHSPDWVEPSVEDVVLGQHAHQARALRPTLQGLHEILDRARSPLTSTSRTILNRLTRGHGVPDSPRARKEFRVCPYRWKDYLHALRGYVLGYEKENVCLFA